MENKLSAKRVADSEVEQVQAIMPNHLNGSGRVFGGQLAAWIDIVGGIVARRHANRNVTTAAIDNLQFKEAVYENSIVVLHGKITYVGRTSMEDVYKRQPLGLLPVNRNQDAWLSKTLCDTGCNNSNNPGMPPFSC